MPALPSNISQTVGHTYHVPASTSKSTLYDFYGWLQSIGVSIEKWAVYLIEKSFPSTKTDPQEHTLVVVSPEELGLPRCATRREIYAKAAQCGLECCSPLLAMALFGLFSLNEQEGCDLFMVAMEPLRNSSGIPEVLMLELSKGIRKLTVEFAMSEFRMREPFKLVFMKKNS